MQAPPSGGSGGGVFVHLPSGYDDICIDVCVAASHAMCDVRSILGGGDPNIRSMHILDVSADAGFCKYPRAKERCGEAALEAGGTGVVSAAREALRVPWSRWAASSSPTTHSPSVGWSLEGSGDVEENSWLSGASWRLVDWRSFPGCCSGPGVSGDQDGVRNPRPAGRQAEDGETARRLGSRLGLIRVSVCLVFGVCHLSFRVRRPPVLARVKGRSDVIPRTACVFSSSRSRAAQSNSPSGVLTGHAGVHN